MKNMNYIIGYSDGWDTPSILHTPAQKGEMFTDVLWVMWPLIIVAIFFIVYSEAGKTYRKGIFVTNNLKKYTGIIGMIVFAIVFFWRIFF